MPLAASYTLSLSVSGNSFSDVKFQVDSAAACNTVLYHHFKRIGKDVDLQPTSAKLISYSEESIRPLDEVTHAYQKASPSCLINETNSVSTSKKRWR